MRRLKLAAALAAVLSISACATHTVPVGDTSITLGANPIVTGVQDFLNSISKFTVADLTYADNLAAKSNDIVSKPCWDFLLKQVEAIPSASPGNLPPLGVATAIQLARNGLSVGSGIPAPFQSACGALILDTQLRLAKAAVGAAGVVASGGTLAPAIGAAGAGISMSLGAAGASMGAIP